MQLAPLEAGLGFFSSTKKNSDIVTGPVAKLAPAALRTRAAAGAHS